MRRPTRAFVAPIFAGVFFSAAPTLLAGPKEDFARLEDKMDSAHEEYVHSKEAGNEGNPSRADRRLDILKKMDALAESTNGSPDGAEIAVRTFLWSARLDLDLENLFARFQRVAKRHSNDMAILEALVPVPDVYKASASLDAWAGALERITRAAENKEIRIAALLASGLVQLDSRKIAPAKAAFEDIIKFDGESDQARLAKGYVFEIEHLQVGMPAPLFTAHTIDGKEVSLKSLRGKVVLLDFWATWCGKCLAETPHLKAAAERFADKPFVIVGVSLDDFKEMLVATIEQKGLPGLQTWDDAGRENPVGVLYNTQELPQWYVIDADGVIRARNPFGEALISAVAGASKPIR